MDNPERLEIDLPPEIAAFIHSQVDQGKHASDSEVVCEAVRALQEKKNAEKIAALRDMVNASIERGGQNTEADVERYLDKAAEESRKRGF